MWNESYFAEHYTHISTIISNDTKFNTKKNPTLSLKNAYYFKLFIIQPGEPLKHMQK